MSLLAILIVLVLQQASPDRGDADALTAVIQEACHRQVVMLGESNTHGDGHTEEFKVALVERLIDECGFDSIVFEANHVEFINIARRLRTRQPISASQVASAVGGLWKFDREFQPLIPFLLAKAQAGQISLGGMDDQLGGLEHIAKQAGPNWGDRSGRTFASYVHKEYGARAFSLGFAALGGSYRQGRSSVRELTAAPWDSVEAAATQRTASSAVFVGPRQLAAMGTREGAIFGHSYQTLPWANFVDGVVVFRTEHPPGALPTR